VAESDTPWRDAATLEQLYWDEGLSLDDIADRLGCSDVTVLNWMEKHDIERRTEKRNRLPRPLTVTSPGSTNQGYEFVWHDDHCVRHHRLLAVAEHGVEAVRGHEIHHRNGIPWDNRPSNLAVVGSSEHGCIHSPEPARESTPPTTERAKISCPDCGEVFLSVGSHWRQTNCKPPTPSARTRRIIDGLVLGDGHVHFAGANRPGYLQVRMTSRRFVEWLDERLGWLSTGARLYRPATNRRRAVYSVRTRSLDWFDRYRSWYADGEPWISDGYSLSRMAARTWYVSDGSACWNGDRFCSVRIAARRLAAKQRERLLELFAEKGYDVRLTDCGLRFRPPHGHRFLDWTGPSLPGFAYKWETESRERSRRLKP